jgi:hypothetical protein
VSKIFFILTKEQLTFYDVFVWSIGAFFSGIVAGELGAKLRRHVLNIKTGPL